MGSGRLLECLRRWSAYPILDRARCGRWRRDWGRHRCHCFPDETLTAFSGRQIIRYAFAGGCFYASFVGTLVPDAFFITESFTILAMVIVGGMGTLIGPVLGAILLTVLPELLRGIGDLRLIVYGVSVTLVVLFMPGGMVQAGQRIAARLWRRAPASDSTSQT